MDIPIFRAQETPLEFRLGFETEFLCPQTKPETLAELEALFNIEIAPEVGYWDRPNWSKWNLVGDGSIDRVTRRETKMYPMELVSPIFDYEKGLEWIDRVFQWLNKVDASTNKSCGFHVGLSIKHHPTYDLKSINTVKLIMLLNESQILEIFNRTSNVYCLSWRDELKETFNGEIPEWSPHLFSSWFRGKNKYHFVNFKKLSLDNPYLEFRGMGGENYHQKLGMILECIAHFKQVMTSSLIDGLDEDQYMNRCKVFANS